MNKPAGAVAGLSSSQTGILMMIAAIFCFAVMEALAKHLSQFYPVPMVAWARYVFHAVFALAFFVDRRRWPTLRTQRPVLHGLRGLVMFGATMLFFSGVSMLPLADATAVVFGAPLYVAALSALVLGERVGPARILAVLLGFAGILIVIRPGPGFTNWAILLPVAAGFCYALFQLSTRLLGRTDSVWALFFYMPVVGCLLTSAVVPFYWRLPNTEGWLLMAAAGVCGGIGQYFVARAFMIAEAAVVAPFIYTQIVWATLLGLILFGDLPDAWTVLGAGVIIASGLLLWYRERRKPPPAATSPGLPH